MSDAVVLNNSMHLLLEVPSRYSEIIICAFVWLEQSNVRTSSVALFNALVSVFMIVIA